MQQLKVFLDKNKLILYFFIIVIAFLIYYLVEQRPRVSIKPVNENSLSETEKLTREIMFIREQLAKLEPAAPVKIISSDQPSKAVEARSASSIILEGTHVPFKVIYEDLAWVRPDYQPYWHSKQGRWSKMPDRIHSAYHHFFVTPGTANLWEEAIYDSGIAELKRSISLPVYDEKPEDTIAVIAIKHKIEDVILLNNQVILLGTPARTGIQVLTINRYDLINSVSGEVIANNSSQDYLFQLVTPDGYEVDYNNVVINY
jgi:hypothetical protein